MKWFLLALCMALLPVFGDALIPDRLVLKGDGQAKRFRIPLRPQWKFLLVQMEMTVSKVVPGKESWRDARFAMRFLDRDGKQVGGWPEVFHRSGSGKHAFRRVYAIPAKAAELIAEPANFGISGTVEFQNILLKGGESSSEFILPMRPPNGTGEAENASLDDAWTLKTPTREKICLNGLWKFRPVLLGEPMTPPRDSGWGYFKVPGSWPGTAKGQQFYLPEEYSSLNPATLNAAWYRRSFPVPAHWTGRTIRLNADLIQTYAEIWVDGKFAGNLLFPGGYFDLTGRLIPGKKQTLDILVCAKSSEPTTYMGPGRVVKSSGLPKNRGIAGDLYLESVPSGAFLGDVHMIPSFRKKKITFDTALNRLPPGTWRLTASVFEHGNRILTFRSPEIVTAGAREFRYAFGGNWPDPKLWDTDTPQNLYTVQVSLENADGKPVDISFPDEFGFREFYISGRDFFLNGKKIHLRSMVTKSVVEPAYAGRDMIEHLVKSGRGFGANSFIGWNYNFSPGVFGYYDSFHRICSEHGMLTTVTLPHVKDFGGDLDLPENARAYRHIAEHIIRRVQNIPGVILYVMNHNALGYKGDQNPLKMGGEYKPAVGGKSIRAQGEKAEKIAKELDSSLPYYHHAGGNSGDVYTVNCYLNWAPRQERDDWFEHWEKFGTRPIFIVEWGIPHVASWSSYRGPEFIWRASGVQCLWINEFNAAVLGPDAYLDSDAKKANAANQWKQISGNRPVKFSALGGNGILNTVEDVHQVRAYMLERNLRSHRARGLSGFLPWDQFLCWHKTRSGGEIPSPKAFENLKKPGLVPDCICDNGEYINNTRSMFEFTATGRALHRGFREYLGWIGGAPGNPTENGHNFNPGESVVKSLILLNDTRRDREITWKWSAPDLDVQQSGVAKIAPGERAVVPVKLRIPEKYSNSKIKLFAEFDFPGQGRETDSLELDVLRKPVNHFRSRIGFYDPEKTGLLGKSGIEFRNVSSEKDLNEIGILVIGRGGMKNLPFDLSRRIWNGLRVLVLEQDLSTLSRLGFRGNEYGLREVFGNVSRFYRGKLHDWRGSSTLLPDYLKIPEPESGNPSWKWEGLSCTRVWRAGNRGTVASVLPEKPQVGNWVALLHGGFDLQYAPVLEFREGTAHMILSQLDLSGRTEDDPEGGVMLRNMLARLDVPLPGFSRKVFYSGGPKGETLLKSMRIPFTAGVPDSTDALLVLGDHAVVPENLKQKLEDGLSVLSLGLSRREFSNLLPENDLPVYGKYAPGNISALERIPVFSGISEAELYFRYEREFDAFPENSPGGRTLSRFHIGKGMLVAFQLPPWTFDPAEFSLRTTVRHANVLTARLLSNLGAVSATGFPDLFKPGEGNELFELPNHAWKGRTDPENKGRNLGYFKPDFVPDSNWKPVSVPGCFDEQRPEWRNYDGFFWYRLEFDLTKEQQTSLNGLLSFGAIDDESWIWLNGRFLGETSRKTNPLNYWTAERRFRISSQDFVPGKNVIVVLCRDIYMRGGILGVPGWNIRKRHSFYLDIPVASDNPYRYYRW